MKTCKNCAWFCQSDRSCYRPDMMQAVRISMPEKSSCNGYVFDGLEDWEREREPENVLMTMVPELA